MIKTLLIGAGAYIIYLWAKGRELTGQSSNAVVVDLQTKLNYIQTQIYQAAVAVASQGSHARPPLFFHELGTDGVLGTETRGALATQKWFARQITNEQMEAWFLQPLRNLDTDQASADDMLDAIDPFVEWANNLGAEAAVPLTLELGTIYLNVTGQAQ
jgi:hypothetical protein